jgi:hypothetical protein
MSRYPRIKANAKRLYPGQKPSSSTTPQPPLNAGGTLLKNSMAQNIAFSPCPQRYEQTFFRQ